MCPGTKRKAFRKETPEEKAAKKRLIDTLWLAAATATTLAAAAGVRSGTEKACSAPSMSWVKKLSPPQPGDNIRQTKTAKVQLAKSESRLG